MKKPKVKLGMKLPNKYYIGLPKNYTGFFKDSNASLWWVSFGIVRRQII